MLFSQGDLSIMFSNGLVGSITALALLMLFWPLISKAIAYIRPHKKSEFATEQPVD
jgi:putative tricarboxylic transport membrane protein